MPLLLQIIISGVDVHHGFASGSTKSLESAILAQANRNVEDVRARQRVQPVGICSLGNVGLGKPERSGGCLPVLILLRFLPSLFDLLGGPTTLPSRLLARIVSLHICPRKIGCLFESDMNGQKSPPRRSMRTSKATFESRSWM